MFLGNLLLKLAQHLGIGIELVLEYLLVALLDLLEQGAKCWIPGQLSAENKRIDKIADRTAPAGQCSHCRRRGDQKAFLLAVAMEQHLVCGQQHRVEGGLVDAGQRTQLGHELWIEREAVPPGGRAVGLVSGRRTRQIQQRHLAAQIVLPEGSQLLTLSLKRILFPAHKIVVAQGVDRRWLRSLAQRRVAVRQIVAQDLLANVIRRNMVDAPVEQVRNLALVIYRAQDRYSHDWSAAQIKGKVSGLGNPCRNVRLRPGGAINDGKSDYGSCLYLLHRLDCGGVGGERVGRA